MLAPVPVLERLDRRIEVPSEARIIDVVAHAVVVWLDEPGGEGLPGRHRGDPPPEMQGMYYLG